MDDYLINYNEVSNISIEKLLEKIKSRKGKPLEELKVKDLSYYNSNAIYPGLGVYIFRNGEQIKLVGKVSSMSFTERIAKHFDYRTGAWFNRLLTLVCEKELELEKKDINFMTASKYAFENFNLILINFEFENLGKINNMEKLLRSCTNALNKFKVLKYKNLGDIVNDCI